MNKILRAWRESHGLSLQQMASEMKISTTTLWRWEYLEAQPTRAMEEMLHNYMARKDQEGGGK